MRSYCYRVERQPKRGARFGTVCAGACSSPSLGLAFDKVLRGSVLPWMDSSAHAFRVRVWEIQDNGLSIEGRWERADWEASRELQVHRT